MRVPPAQRSLTAFSLEVCGRQQEQKLLNGCLSTELKEIRGSERVVWLQWPSQRASNTICRKRREDKQITQGFSSTSGSVRKKIGEAGNGSEINEALFEFAFIVSGLLASLWPPTLGLAPANER
ncbi:hypothetical protein CHARACLAT_029246 [Characodon lateralis]|uniref:Uncharacterized protein n=1 Tax=Characodon lateralis TaxID=208331 RepID=A0ABU7E4J0_9TELE|nr:hypothetical protein [Characodon lateralis]